MSGENITRIPASHLTSVDEPERRLRLVPRLRRALRARRYSARTEQAYADWVVRYVKFHGRRHPALMQERDIGAFLS